MSAADLVDLWTRLSTAFKNNAGVYAYGLMNEPHDLPGSTGSFTGVVRYDWNGGTVAGWTGDTATATNVSSKLHLAATATTGYFNFRKDDAATLAGGSLSGNTLQATITLGAGITGSWKAILQWQTAAFVWQTPTSTTYTRVDTGATVGGLIAGVAVTVRATWSGGITSPAAFAIQIEANDATAGAVSVDVDDFSQGTLTGSGTGAQTWETISQQVVTAIRANGDSKKILVPGYGFSGAKTWADNHPRAWITDTVNNTVVARAVKETQESVKRGEAIAAPLERHEIFPPMVTQMIAVGEEAGMVDEMLEKVSDFYDQEIEATVDALTSLLEPLLIVVLGGAVGGMVVALYMPMFKIIELVQ